MSTFVSVVEVVGAWTWGPALYFYFSFDMGVFIIIHKTQKGMCAALRTHPFPYFKLYNKAGDPKF